MNREITKKVTKGAWGMPRLSEAKKDVISCEKHRGSANRNRSGDVRMGKPVLMKSIHPGNRKQTRRTETSKYPEEEKTIVIP